MPICDTRFVFITNNTMCFNNIIKRLTFFAKIRFYNMNKIKKSEKYIFILNEIGTKSLPKRFLSNKIRITGNSENVQKPFLCYKGTENYIMYSLNDYIKCDYI